MIPALPSFEVAQETAVDEPEISEIMRIYKNFVGGKFVLSDSTKKIPNDTSKSLRFVDAIETGITHVNSSTTGGEAQVPFGGIKATGIGDREQVSTTLDFYTEVKVVYVDYTGTKHTGHLY